MSLEKRPLSCANMERAQKHSADDGGAEEIGSRQSLNNLGVTWAVFVRRRHKRRYRHRGPTVTPPSPEESRGARGARSRRPTRCPWKNVRRAAVSCSRARRRISVRTPEAARSWAMRCNPPAITARSCEDPPAGRARRRHLGRDPPPSDGRRPSSRQPDAQGPSACGRSRGTPLGNPDGRIPRDAAGPRYRSLCFFNRRRRKQTNEQRGNPVYPGGMDTVQRIADSQVCKETGPEMGRRTEVGDPPNRRPGYPPVDPCLTAAWRKQNGEPMKARRFVLIVSGRISPAPPGSRRPEPQEPEPLQRRRSPAVHALPSRPCG